MIVFETASRHIGRQRYVLGRKWFIDRKRFIFFSVKYWISPGETVRILVLCFPFAEPPAGSFLDVFVSMSSRKETLLSAFDWRSFYLFEVMSCNLE